MVSFFKLVMISALMLALNACAVYPASYGGYYSSPMVTRSRVVMGGGYYPPRPRVFIGRNYGYPQHYQRFYGPGWGHGHGHWNGHGGHHGGGHPFH